MTCGFTAVSTVSQSCRASGRMIIKLFLFPYLQVAVFDNAERSKTLDSVKFIPCTRAQLFKASLA